MEKLVYITWLREAKSHVAHAAAVLDVAKREILPRSRALTVQVADLAADPRIVPRHFMGEGAKIGSAVSIWIDNLDDRAPIEKALGSVSARADGYLVTESIPQACRDRSWPDGAKSPGMTQFVCFPKPDRLSDEEFFRGWHEEHTPFSFELHPSRWSYTRNAVARTLTKGSPPYRAIVEERWRTFEAWLDPAQLFASPEILAKCQDDIVGYADFESLHQTVMSEHILKSL
jgi:hypothetical protein